MEWRHFQAWRHATKWGKIMDDSMKVCVSSATRRPASDYGFMIVLLNQLMVWAAMLKWRHIAELGGWGDRPTFLNKGVTRRQKFWAISFSWTQLKFALNEDKQIHSLAVGNGNLATSKSPPQAILAVMCDCFSWFFYTFKRVQQVIELGVQTTKCFIFMLKARQRPVHFRTFCRLG